METKKFKTADEYLSSLPRDKRDAVQQLRTLIKESAPGAEEVISYNMPAYKFHGLLVYMMAHAEHIGFYPFSSSIRVFKNKLTSYKTSKGTIQFPLGKNIPAKLVKDIVKFRVKENLEKERMRKLKKKKVS